MENPKNQLASKLKDASNVLVTVSTNPSVDQLAAAIGLTLFLTKIKKHATTVFSGEVPSTIDFLKPEETIENNTDSLRDFIISLDKNKADKIRYKVEDTMVKIFITPYRTSIGEQDLVFGQGDFNVDVVIAIGIHNKDDLDQAIVSHGRILHDATVATLNTKEGSDIGTLNWIDNQASSLCEMAVALTDLMKANSLDGQMATAFLTGIVAETERFSNDKTTSNTMNASAKLMAAGANQQLVATKLEPPEPETPAAEAPKAREGEQSKPPEDAHVDSDGSLRIDHESSIPESGKEQPAQPKPEEPKPAAPPTESLPEPIMPEPEEPQPPVSQVKIDDDGELQVEEPHIKQDHREFLGKRSETENHDMFGLPSGDPEDAPAGAQIITEPPKFGGQLSAAADDSSGGSSPLNLPPVNTPILSHNSGSAKKDQEGQEPEHDDEDKSPPEPPKQDTPSAPAPPPPPPPPPPEPASPVLSTPPKGDEPSEKDEKKEEPAADEQSDKAKLPEAFVKSLDNSTLSGLEEKVDSPHLQTQPQATSGPEPVDYHKVAAEQVAKAVSGKTLDEIEEQVDSPHAKQDAPGVIPPAVPKKEEHGLAYEPIASEPPDSTTAASDDNGVADTTADDTQAATSADTTDDNTTTALTDTNQEDAPADDTKSDAEREAEAEEARNAVMQAIGSGGDSHTATDEAGAPPAAPPPVPQKPSPHIEIDDKGNLKFAHDLPADATASPSDDASPPPVPPPMVPPLPSPVDNSQNT